MYKRARIPGNDAHAPTGRFSSPPQKQPGNEATHHAAVNNLAGSKVKIT